MSPRRPGGGRTRRRRWPLVMLAAHAVIAAVLLGRARGWLEPAELVAYDQFIVAWAGEDRSDRIVLVTASEADIGRYGWPLRDADLAALLERLTGWGARAIGVDIYRDRPVGPGGEVLDDLLRRHPEIYWVSKLPDAAADDQGVPPPAVLADSARAVLADVVLDAGGVARRGLLAATDARSGRSVHSLGAALAEHAVGEGLRPSGADVVLGGGRIVLLDAAFGPYARVDAAGYQTLLDFRGGPARFARIGLGELKAGDAPAALVRGRLVLVGTEAPSVKDSFATPFGTFWREGGMLLGVALHAHLADQLLRIHAGEASSLAPLPREAEAGIVWASGVVAAALSLVLPSALLAFGAVPRGWA